MPKRLVLCCDGTWNTPDEMRGSEPAPTNVTKIALAVAPKDSTGVEQRTFYHQGVGTSPGERISGGAFGFGLSRNVRDTYRFLVQNFEPGDKLYFFGFSRGAFTARSTVGFVRNCGILRREYADRVDEAYALYRSRSSRTHPRSIEAQLFRSSYSHETNIRFIGVWDTVGALGIPLSGLRLINLFNRRWQFHDTELSSTVEAAFQALAIDEKRGPFRPAIWTPPENADGQRLEQMWFAGVHSDIGGGYQDCALADIALLWMVDRVRECDLVFKSDAFAPLSSSGTRNMLNTGTSVRPDPLGRLHESRTAFYRLLRPYIRCIGVADKAHEDVARAAIDRRRQMAYSPPNLIGYLNRAQQPYTCLIEDGVAKKGNTTSDRDRGVSAEESAVV